MSSCFSNCCCSDSDLWGFVVDSILEQHPIVPGYNFTVNKLCKTWKE